MTQPNQPECKCACHENKLKKPYEHDTKCCEEMNGTVTTNTVGSVEELAKGFESWDSFYSGLTIEQETEQDPIKLYEQYLIEYIKDALDTVQQQAKAEENEKAINALKMATNDAEHGGKMFGMQYFSTLAHMFKICTAQEFIKTLNQDTNQTNHE